MYSTKIIEITGRVQGVGFRPFIFVLANEFQLKGTVQNNMDGVKIYIEGTEQSIDKFLQAIKQRKPRLAKIYSMEIRNIERIGFKDFQIIPSDDQGKSELVIPIDASTCPNCLHELHNPKNKRYMYPFINCTDCGPRYTIIEGLPYDRIHTTMKSFQMCPNCQKEYGDSTNRRYHAQPNACLVCGPQYVFDAIDGVSTTEQAIDTAIQYLEAGKIVAIKGIGGYHLVCDAKNPYAIQALRTRKNRYNKPLAVIARGLEVLEKVCEVTDAEKQLLMSVEAPIVLCTKKDIKAFPKELAPNLNTVGVMLPYAPIHSVLFAKTKLDFLVMTSANPSKLPMLYKDKEAKSYLANLADGILTHNREIVHPIDDSVVQVVNQTKLQIIRRARGFAPEPKFVKQNVNGIVAFGSQQKNTFALGRNQQVFISPYIGDLDALEMMAHFEQEMKHLLHWLDIQPQLVVVDMHPAFSSRAFVSQFHTPVYEVQHHHAHMVSCMAEHHALGKSAFGIILDGTGYGMDGHIWGFEILYGSEKNFERKGHLKYTALPGGEKSIQEPWKNAVGMLISLFGSEKGYEMACTLFPNHTQDIKVLQTMVSRGINSPLAGTCGRLFDAVSAMLGICKKQDYDGEAAVRLSEQANLAQVNQIESYDYEISSEAGCYELSLKKMLLQIYDAVQKKESLEVISSRFHQTIICAICDIMVQLKDESLSPKVFCSGGSFHNQFLYIGLNQKLSALGFEVFFQQDIPTNDGGLSLGQLLIGQSYLEGE